MTKTDDYRHGLFFTILIMNISMSLLNHCPITFMTLKRTIAPRFFKKWCVYLTIGNKFLLKGHAEKSWRLTIKPSLRRLLHHSGTQIFPFLQLCIPWRILLTFLHVSRPSYHAASKGSVCRHNFLTSRAYWHLCVCDKILSDRTQLERSQHLFISFSAIDQQPPWPHKDLSDPPSFRKPYPPSNHPATRPAEGQRAQGSCTRNTSRSAFTDV